MTPETKKIDTVDAVKTYGERRVDYPPRQPLGSIDETGSSNRDEGSALFLEAGPGDARFI